jgi:hypothetical protein
MNAGTRFTRRGLDENGIRNVAMSSQSLTLTTGNAANFCEQEQIVLRGSR